MNKERRKAIKAALTTFTATLNMEAFDTFKEAIEQIKGDEEEAYENLSEGAQEGERGEKMSAAIEALEDIINVIDEANNALIGLDDQANTAME